MKLYKFRSMHNLKRFLDILINKRLYMAHYNEMNDPMEGYFYYDPAYKNLATDVSMGKQSKLICCLSTDYKNTLLWSHYADSHQGCCIEVEVTSKLSPYFVDYSSRLPVIDPKNCDVTSVLTHKSSYWKYESEVRFIKDAKTSTGNSASPYIKVRILKIYLGWKMDSKDVKFYTSLIHSILGPNVEVVKMKRDDIDSGLF